MQERPTHSALPLHQRERDPVDVMDVVLPTTLRPTSAGGRTRPNSPGANTAPRRSTTPTRKLTPPPPPPPLQGQSQRGGTTQRTPTLTEGRVKTSHCPFFPLGLSFSPLCIPRPQVSLPLTWAWSRPSVPGGPRSTHASPRDSPLPSWGLGGPGEI